MRKFVLFTLVAVLCVFSATLNFAGSEKEEVKK